MRRNILLIAALLFCTLLAGCASSPSGSAPIPPRASKRDNIPFAEDQFYAVAHLGYQEIENLEFYAEQYLDSNELPVHYFSDGDYYLVIPRYSGMKLALYHNDIETLEPTLLYEDPDCQPFILQCNASDIFADATISLTYEEETAEFSPFISLKDGSVEIGDQGLDLTRSAETQQTEP